MGLNINQPIVLIYYIRIIILFVDKKAICSLKVRRKTRPRKCLDLERENFESLFQRLRHIYDILMIFYYQYQNSGAIKRRVTPKMFIW